MQKKSMNRNYSHQNTSKDIATQNTGGLGMKPNIIDTRTSGTRGTNTQYQSASNISAAYPMLINTLRWRELPSSTLFQVTT